MGPCSPRRPRARARASAPSSSGALAWLAPRLLGVLLLLWCLPSSDGAVSPAACRASLANGGQCLPGRPCPDLIIDGPRAQRSVRVERVQIAPNSCAVQEGCVVPGWRKLLRFDIAVPNIGSGDLHLGDPKHMKSCFEFGQCHSHWHFTGFASYTLRPLNEPNRVIAGGGKRASCLMDSLRWSGASSQQRVVPSRDLYQCSNQGIHAGYQDVYGSHLDCQWIDVTDVAPGSYIMRLHVNPDRVLPESDYTNNIVQVRVTVPKDGLPPVAAPSSCAQQGGCESCTAQPSCGWCATSGACQSGSYLGPSSGRCGQWFWPRNSCPRTPTPPPSPSVPNRPNCAAIKTCQSCTAATGCGWCGSHSQCVEGDSRNAFNLYCQNWQFGPRNTCGNCAALTSCQTCTAATGCGWCKRTQQCTGGSWHSSGQQTCTGRDWMWITQQCPATSAAGRSEAPTPSRLELPAPAPAAEPCAAATDCTACARTRGCGWCPTAPDGSKCQAGNWLGPAAAADGKVGTCLNSQGESLWSWSAATCAAPPAGEAKSLAVQQEQCSTWTDCSSCALASGCGWCPSSSQCLAGTSTQPSKPGACPSASPSPGSGAPWVWSSSQCAPPPSAAQQACAVNLDCNSCAALHGCGWCPATGRCTAGTWLGPDSAAAACPSWLWSAHLCTISHLHLAQLGASLGNGSHSGTGSSSAPPSWQPTPVDPSPFLKSQECSLDDVLKMDAAGNSFKLDWVGQGIKADAAGDFFKRQLADATPGPAARDAQLLLPDDVPVPAFAADPQGLTRAPQSQGVSLAPAPDVPPLPVIDPYDPDPANPEFPHGHREPPHFMTMDESMAMEHSAHGGAAGCTWGPLTPLGTLAALLATGGWLRW